MTGTGLRRSALAAMAAVALCVAIAAGRADAAPARGIDVSRFQGTIDWRSVATTKIRFAWVAASRGRGSDCLVAPTACGTDPFYDSNYEEARAYGLTVGPYHRAFIQGKRGKRAKRDARREAGVFVRSVGGLEPGDLRPVLDVETPFRSSVNQRRAKIWIRTWLRKVRRKLGAKPMIYTNHSSWQATGDTLRFARAGYDLWVANYGVESPAVPADNWAGGGYSAWQFTSTGSVDGVSGNVDKNRLGGPMSKITIPLEAPGS